MLDAITVRPQASETEVLDKLERYGIALLPGYAPTDQLDRVQQECLDLLDREEKASPQFLTKGESRVARIDAGIDPVNFPLLSRLFLSPYFHNVAKDYFAPYAFTLNRQVYITHDRNVMNFSSQWHIDPSRSLKFLLYVMDTTRENGAFMYAPGSHREGFFRIMYFRSRGIDAVPNKIPDHEVPLVTVSVEGKAGSLIIFEAAGFHRAGVLQPGQERLVIRGHSYPHTSMVGRLLRRFLLRSPFNMSRYRLCEDDCVNDRFKTLATPLE